MKTTRHYLVSGLVQGVGYRRFAEKAALELGLTGWVRNLHDGRVEVVATGEPSRLNAFLQRLNEGPRAAEVSDVKEKHLERTEEFQHFRVVMDGEKPWES